MTGRFVVQPDVNAHFAWLRTRMSLESVFMAWIRTAVSLIGFGFTITQFFERLREMGGPTPRPMALQTPRDLGLALIATGIFCLVLASWQYRAQVRYLWSTDYAAIAGRDSRAHRTPVFIAALVLIVIGIAAFGAVLFRLA
jgi:putative membrane protein